MNEPLSTLIPTPIQVAHAPGLITSDPSGELMSLVTPAPGVNSPPAADPRPLLKTPKMGFFLGAAVQSPGGVGGLRPLT